MVPFVLLHPPWQERHRVLEHLKMIDCIDLKAMFGEHYRVQRDPAYSAQYGPSASRKDAWHWEIPGQHGEIYPHGRELLGAATRTRGAISNRLIASSLVRVTQDGSDGVNVVFHVRDFEAVAEILGAKRRRKLDRAHRDKLVSAGQTALARHRNSKWQNSASGSNPSCRKLHETCRDRPTENTNPNRQQSCHNGEGHIKLNDKAHLLQQVASERLGPVFPEKGQEQNVR
jgi:hypothetical protein